MALCALLFLRFLFCATLCVFFVAGLAALQQ